MTCDSRSRPRRWITAGVGVVLRLLCTAASGCTDAPHPSDESPCESCRIERETVWESREQDPDVEMGLTLFRIGDHFWGSGGMFGHRIVGLSASHDSSIVIDRPGDGPGEFESDITWAVRIPGDSIVFFNSRTASVFDSRMRYVREFAVPGPVYASGAFFDPVEDEIIGYTPGAIFRLSRDGSLAAVDSSATLQGRFRPIAPVPGHRHLFFELRRQQPRLLGASTAGVGIAPELELHAPVFSEIEIVIVAEAAGVQVVLVLGRAVQSALPITLQSFDHGQDGDRLIEVRDAAPVCARRDRGKRHRESEK